jgi:hypothetical protein
LLLIDRTQIIDVNGANVRCTPLLVPQVATLDGRTPLLFIM